MNSIDKDWVDNHIGSNGEVIIPEGVQVIKKGAFQGNDKIRRIIMPSSIVGIEPRAFADCSNLQEVKLNDNLQILGMNAFKNCPQLKAIDIPNKVKNIYQGTFEGNTNLESITLNGDLYYLSTMSFNNCEKIEYITINSTGRIDYGDFLKKVSIRRIKIDGQEITLDDKERLFSLQKVEEKVAIVTKDEKGKFLTRAMNLEKRYI